MANEDLAARIRERAARAGVHAGDDVVRQLGAYLALLAQWNRRINLTALPVEPPSDDALDRLIVEPLLAARHVLAADRLAIDVGSGGGSPAIPLKLAAPSLRFVLVEARVKKSAFLREVVRQLGLSEVEVETRRMEELAAQPALAEAADLVTMRAVKANRALLAAVDRVLKRGGRLLWFGAGETSSLPDSFGKVSPSADGGGLVIFSKIAIKP